MNTKSAHRFSLSHTHTPLPSPFAWCTLSFVACTNVHTHIPKCIIVPCNINWRISLIRSGSLAVVEYVFIFLLFVCFFLLLLSLLLLSLVLDSRSSYACSTWSSCMRNACCRLSPVMLHLNMKFRANGAMVVCVRPYGFRTRFCAVERLIIVIIRARNR